MKKPKIPPNNAPRVYTKRIDFTSESDNWPMRGSFMVHVKEIDALGFIKSVIRNGLDAFELSIRPNFGFAGKRCMVLVCRASSANTIDESVQSLLRLCSFYSADLTYKEGDYGYSIDRDGKILKRWPLDDGAS